MKSRTLKSIVLGVALIGATGVAPRESVRARQSQSSGGGTVSINNQAGRVQIKLERGSKVAVSNRYGRITITGWDRDTVEAVATGPKGAEAVQVEMTADPQATSSRLSLAVVGRARQQQPPGYASAPATAATIYAPTTEAAQKAREKLKDAQKAAEDKAKDKAAGRTETPEGGYVIVQPPTVTVAPPSVVIGAAPPAQPGRPAPAAAPRPAPRPGTYAAIAGASASAGRAEEIHLDVKVPRFAHLDTIEVRSGDLNISSIDGPVSVAGGSSNITASRVGALTVRTRGGNVNADGVEGMVYVVANSGDITISNAGSEVRATTNNGDINISCARGRVDASTAFGKVTLANVGGDVDANTTNSDISFTGPITDGARYRLKSMEGRVTMAIPEGSPGFTANLMSYNREVASDFTVRAATPNPVSQTPRRVEAHHGNGRAVITLDSFGQTVRLSKLAPGSAVACR